MTPKAVSLLVLSATALIAVLGVAVELIGYLVAPSWAGIAVPFLSLSYEFNLPTWYAVCLIYTSGLITMAIARGESRSRRRYFYTLAVALFYISLDEMVQLHEALSDYIPTSGILYFGWIIPAGAIALVLGVYFLGLLRSLEPPYRRRLVLAGAVYVGGALAMELPLGYWTEHAGSDNLTYALIDAVEETMELAGMSIYFHTAYTYMRALADTRSSASAA